MNDHSRQASFDKRISIVLASSVACIEISHLYTNRRRLSAPLFPFPFSSPSPPSLLPSLFPSLPAPPPTSVMNAQAGVAGQDASVGPTQLARAPTRSSQSPKSYWVEWVGEKMGVVVVPQCARWGGGVSAEGPTSYRGLGLRHAVAAAGPGLASGPLAPASSGPLRIRVPCPIRILISRAYCN